ncbi:phage baseplate protein [Superficieibacter sp. BNK-5]|uniref:phage baseplate protein n=1 Tax=Superficieibacter sp. BNK-5 TaxID=3376142 RepID=UPI0039BFD209
MDILSTLFHQQSRKIDILIPDVVITEKHSDNLEITEHPVERQTSTGAGFIADHAYRRPSEVVMEIGFSGGGTLLDLLDTSRIGLSLGISPRETYQKLLDLQRSRKPFSVTTGKKLYENMLIKVLDVTTDKTSENVLMATLTLRELIISETQTVNVAAKDDMKEGANTSAVQNSGMKTPKPVTSQSVLSKLSDLFSGG